MHQRMSVDIETYSSIDLTKSGVYKYTEAPDFDILLIGYSFDDEEEVQVIDTYNLDEEGRAMMTEFMDALHNPRIIKTAFNANFERTCLAKWTEKEMPPEMWRDTMILALELGLPRSLEDVGMALGLPEDKLKDPQGKALINFFSKPCKPTKANGGRTRNLPQHDSEKWIRFKEYNRRDMEVEMAIKKIIS